MDRGYTLRTWAVMQSPSIDTRKLTSKASQEGMVEPEGFVPTEWMPISMSAFGGKLYVATDKGKGTGPNNFPQHPVETVPASREADRTYIGTLLYGSLATISVSEIASNFLSGPRPSLHPTA